MKASEPLPTLHIDASEVAAALGQNKFQPREIAVAKAWTKLYPQAYAEAVERIKQASPMEAASPMRERLAAVRAAAAPDVRAAAAERDPAKRRAKEEAAAMAARDQFEAGEAQTLQTALGAIAAAAGLAGELLTATAHEVQQAKDAQQRQQVLDDARSKLAAETEREEHAAARWQAVAACSAAVAAAALAVLYLSGGAECAADTGGVLYEAYEAAAANAAGSGAAAPDASSSASVPMATAASAAAAAPAAADVGSSLVSQPPSLLAAAAAVAVGVPLVLSWRKRRGAARVRNAERQLRATVQDVSPAQSQSSQRALQSTVLGDVNKRRGTINETAALDLAARDAGCEVFPDDRVHWKELSVAPVPVTVVIKGRVDGWRADGRVVVEVKSRQKRLFLNIPKYELVQLQCYMWLTDTEQCQHTQVFNGKSRTEMVQREADWESAVLQPGLQHFVRDVIALSKDLAQQQQLLSKPEVVSKLPPPHRRRRAPS